MVLLVVHQGLSKSSVARRYGVSWQWVHTLVTRYHEGGLDAVERRSSRPKTNPRRTSDEVRTTIIQLRLELSAEGLDAGPVTIAWHLEQGGHLAPSTSTIRRVLLDAGLISAQPQKRPHSSLKRFVADQPNECWQSDFTHWQLGNGSEVEIIDWLDDHSRYLLALRAFDRVTGPVVVDTFKDCVNNYGPPAATLTDNGVVYTARLVGGRNALEHLLGVLGVDQRNGHPGHPQTQGKIERFHQTLKKWLRQQAPAATLAELQGQLDRFRDLYNERRPHRGLGRSTPGAVYRATPKAAPANGGVGAHFRLRFDVVDRFGKITLRHAGIVHHLGVGIEHAGEKVLMLVDERDVTVTNVATGEVLSTHQIDDASNYWRNQLKSPGRWPREI